MSSTLKQKNRQKLRSRTMEIRKAITSMDLLSSGTLYTRMKRCGRLNCRCANDPEALHGPYYEWNRWIDGRLVHRIVSEDQAELVSQAISNQREVKRLLFLWEQETAEEILSKGKPRKRRNPS
jgi:hypothetical protein